MFITVMFGAGCWELVNPWCSLVTLTAHLRQRGRVPADAAIALLAEDGHLVSLEESLEEGTSQVPSLGRTRLRERETYILVQIIKGEDGAPTRYESLLENLDDQCPELAGECQGEAHPPGWGRTPFPPNPYREGFLGLSDELRWLSGLPPTGGGRRRRRRTGTRHGHLEQRPPCRPRRVGSLPSRTR
ncbi:uncharacterized protein C22orf15 homolog isoform X2 [Dasypus novemcinctus]|uniref:uncharacterized protein C22orf15 homolog isoform X2 n=1 Tax=Dasypus novemcinctus TaxID=9361 RepID=UPI00265E5C9B|nr:uncharacterized protein C22orf15 homolog isoform X2 [Dasypus novemcinctus]